MHLVDPAPVMWVNITLGPGDTWATSLSGTPHMHNSTALLLPNTTAVDCPIKVVSSTVYVNSSGNVPPSQIVEGDTAINRDSLFNAEATSHARVVRCNSPSTAITQLAVDLDFSTRR